MFVFRVRAGCESGKENIVNHYYPDADTYALVDSVSALSSLRIHISFLLYHLAFITEMPREQVWEMYGGFLIEYTMEIGWDELMRTMSPNLKLSKLVCDCLLIWKSGKVWCSVAKEIELLGSSGSIIIEGKYEDEVLAKRVD
jgi:hypothetical protein